MIARRPVSILLTLGAVLVAAGPAASQETFRLGVLLGLTGPGKPYSDEGLRGIKLAVDEINAAGGLLGRYRIELLVRNTRTNPEVARAMAQELVAGGKLHAVIGTYSSASALAIKPVLREARVVHMATISNAEEITKLDPSPFTFSVVPNTYMMAKATAIATARLAKDKGWSRYATIASDYVWGRSSQGLQVELLKQMAPGLTLVGDFWPPLGEVSFNSYAVAVLNAKPDFLLETIAGVDNELWERAARDYRLDRRLERVFPLVSVVELMRERKWLLRGSWARTRAPFFAHLDIPMMKTFVDSYRAGHGSRPSDWAVMSYDGVHAIRQGVEKARSIDPDAVRQALTGATIETTRGRLYFRAIDNQLSCSAYVGRIADAGGYDHPIYADLVELKAEEIWRPEGEIRQARGQ